MLSASVTCHSKTSNQKLLFYEKSNHARPVFFIFHYCRFCLQPNNGHGFRTAAGATAKVIFMRSTGGQGALIPFSTFIDDKLVCRLNNKHFSTHAVPAGTHTVSVQVGGKEGSDKTEHITINAEAGKTYYIQMVSKVGLLINNLSCKEVTEDAANKVLSKLKEDADCL
jgi:hypothetical protein